MQLAPTRCGRKDCSAVKVLARNLEDPGSVLCPATGRWVEWGQHDTGYNQRHQSVGMSMRPLSGGVGHSIV